MEIRWNEEHEMGIEEFDHDHKQLFVIAGRLVDKVRDPKSIADVRVRLFVLREGVQYLRGYFDEHAIREEAYMRRMGYADYALHKQLHDEFMANTLQGYEKMVERGTCSREEVLDFVGRGIGWLVEHISTADLAIVGRGTLGKPRLTKINAQVVEREFNTIFASTLNKDVQTRLIDPNYAGAPFGPAICQELTYRRGDRKVTVLAGLENSFLTAAAEAVYGAQLQGMEALIISTMEIFRTPRWSLWRTTSSPRPSSRSATTGTSPSSPCFLTAARGSSSWPPRPTSPPRPSPSISAWGPEPERKTRERKAARPLRRAAFCHYSTVLRDSTMSMSRRRRRERRPVRKEKRMVRRAAHR